MLYNIILYNITTTKLYYILYDFIEENNLENKSIKFIKMKIMEHNNKLKDFLRINYG